MIKLLERREYAESLAKDLSMGTKNTDGAAIRKGFIPLDIKAIEDNVLQFIVSDGSIDRDNDTINVQGWNLANYLKNPVFLWAHEHHSAPIGKGINPRVEDEKLISDTEFVGGDIMPFAEMVKDLYKGGFMNAVSVGFMPDERVWSDEQNGIKFLTQEMLEFSAVPVPANPNALQLGAKAGIDISPMKSWAEQLLEEWTDGNRPVGASRKSLERMFKIADDKKRVTSLPTKSEKDLRQHNIWAPRMKEFTETGIWNTEEWGEMGSYDEDSGPEQVPAYIWNEHVRTLKAASKLSQDKEAKRIAGLVESYLARDCEQLNEFALSYTGEDDLPKAIESLLDPDAGIGEEVVELIVSLALVAEMASEATAEKQEPDISEEDIALVRELMDAHGYKSITDESIKEMIEEIEQGFDESKMILDHKASLDAEIKQLTEERDLAVEMVEALVEDAKNSMQRVDPAKMVGMFGATLAKAITRITGKLPT